VILDDGSTYERSAIEAWLSQHDTSPMTNMKLDSKKVKPNLMVRKAIQDFVKKHASVS
jgi:hypothetical protein